MANWIWDLSVVVVATVVPSLAWAQRAPQDDPVLVVETFVQANERADLELIMSTFDETATLFPPGDRPQRTTGKAEIRAFFEGTFGQRRGPITITPTDVHVQRLGDTAVVTAHLGLLPALPVSEATTFSRRTFVVKRVGNRWVIVHLHASNVQLSPPRR